MVKPDIGLLPGGAAVSRIGLSILIASLLFSPVLAGSHESKVAPLRVRHIAVPNDVSYTGKVVGAGLRGSRTDTLYLLGGPLGNGDFQDENGDPDWEGWIGVDGTASESHWQVDTFNCADLDPQQPENHAWWCGAMFEPCHAEDSAEGYGNNWLDYLDWYGTVPDPAINVVVRVTARLNHDVEPGYDFLSFQHEQATGIFTTIATYTGDNRLNGDFVPIDFEESFIIEPSDYIGPSHDQVHLRWRLMSDALYSDQDCDWPTDGAAQVDLIAVYFDQGAGEFQMGETETCEPGDSSQWEVSFEPGCGMFAQVWPYLQDLDACLNNTTPQVAFVDDGIVVPGTGGYLCTTWCYGPNGYIVNPEGGLRGPDFGVHNEIWSPVLEWPGGEYAGATFEFDQYVHETLGPGSPAIFSTWGIISTADPAGETGWDRWDSDIWFFFGPSYSRPSSDVTSAIVTDCRYVRVALVMWDNPWITGTDGTPAP